MIYFDTAYLAKCYLNEHGSEAVRQLATEADRVACCTFGQLELAATIHRNLREEKLSKRQARVIFDQWELDAENRVWTWLPVTPELLAKATATYRRLKPSTYLRSADALHLACAHEHGFREVFTNDRHMLAAASAFKLTGRNVIG